MISVEDIFGEKPNPGHQSTTTEDFQRDLYDIENPAPQGWPEPMGEAAFHGLAGEFVRLVLPQTEADPQALLLCFLTLFGCMVGRKPYWQVEATRHGCNLFCVLVGKTGTGRKGTAVDRAEDILRRVDPEFFKLRRHSGLSSGEGLIQAVRDPREEDVIVEDKKSGSQSVVRKLVDSGVGDKRLLVVETEFSSVLQQCARKGNILVDVIRNGYDGKPLQTMARSNKDACREPHIGILGNITPEDLSAHLTATDKANGFGNRFLWGLSRRSKELPHGGRPLNPARLADLVSGIRSALQAAQTIDRVEWDSDAYTAWETAYSKLTGDADGLYGTMIARAAPQVARLATNYSLLDRSDRISPRHLKAAMEVWAYCDDSVLYVFGDATGNETADAILKILRNAPEGLTRTQINRAFGSHKPARELDVALSLLEKRGKARREEESTGGAPVARWKAA
jgi:hypothetical protein